jgi:hypothetical protein
LAGPCLRHEDCRGGYCDSEILRCLTLCAVDQGCFDGASCVALDPTVPQVGVCLLTCQSDADCSPLGLRCLRASASVRVCFIPAGGDGG